MSKITSLITELIENQSFLEWLEGRCSEDENMNWNFWSKEEELHMTAVSKIKRLRSMPFNHQSIHLSETLSEWEKLKKDIGKE